MCVMVVTVEFSVECVMVVTVEFSVVCGSDSGNQTV